MTVSGFNWQKLHAFTNPPNRINTLEPKGFYVLKWARCLPNWGNVLAHHGHGACPCWAELLSDTCPIYSFCNTHIPVFRLLPTHAIPHI